MDNTDGKVTGGGKIVMAGSILSRHRVTQPQDRVQHREANGVQLISLKFAGCGRHKIQDKKNLSMDLIHCFFILKVVCIPTFLSYDLVLCDRSIFI